MPTPYTPTPTILTTVTALPDDGDLRNVASVNGPMKQLADGIAFVNALAAFSTALPNFTTLTAITTPIDGMARIVRGYGVYVFDASYVYSTFPPYTLVPDDATPGKWVRAGNMRRFHERSVALQSYLTTSCFYTGGTGSTLDGPTIAKSAFFSHTTRLGLQESDKSVSYADLILFVNGGLKMNISTSTPATALGTYGVQWCLDRVLSDGATIVGVNFGIWPNTGRLALPTQPFGAGVFRCPTAPGSALTPILTSLNSGGDFTYDPHVLVDYEAFHQLAVTCNQNNVVDLNKYTYYAQFWNEAGALNTLAGNTIANVTVAMNNYSDAVLGVESD